VLDWVNKQTEPPTIEDFLDQATELRRVSLTAVEPMLETIDCPALARLWEESDRKSRSWEEPHSLNGTTGTEMRTSEVKPNELITPYDHS
jgi:hypothetical protein